MDVLIVGSGPVGASFARTLVGAGIDVLMVEAGAQLARRPGSNLKNIYIYQRDNNLFSSVIRGNLYTLSVPDSAHAELAVDPAGAHGLPTNWGCARHNENPDQDPYRNIPAASASYAVGGMATHWTCATPRHHPVLERYGGIGSDEWDRCYTEAEALLTVSNREFEHSVRQRLIIDALRDEFSELPEQYAVQSLPLAVKRRGGEGGMVTWAGADTVLGDIAEGNAHFSLLPQHLCTRLVPDSAGTRIDHAEVRDLEGARELSVAADHFVVCAGAVLTPQLLWASGIRPDPLGRYLTEHPMAFCQVVLLDRLLDRLGTDPRFAPDVQRHRDLFPDDHVPVPVGDPEPSVWLPLSEGRLWHGQITRDALQFGVEVPHVDDRLIADLRWFGLVDPRPENRVTFSDRHTDIHGMPQPTFDFSFSDDDAARQHAMMEDMLRAATALGGFLPQAEPRFTTLGLPNHIAGTVRMGKDPRISVVNNDSRVWGFDNLYLGGNGVIPTATASNPTLTSVAMALKAAHHLTGRLK
ncbi:GMC oxidoreductase [Streptomyces pacificus]|uniref:GMC oxidoreductase n=1 Tax=Streptomyces pacificus TaxID=2705029 RepID=UPI0020B143D6|nr:GMC oxidoreductase [Streptomyces pacificus]